MEKKCIITDIDGVCVDSRDWNKYIPEDPMDREGWNNFSKYIHLCKPNKKYLDWLISIQDVVKVFFVTSREDCNNMKENTIKQLKDFTDNRIKISSDNLFMRPYKDYRPAHEVKKEILSNKISSEFLPIMAIDDDIDNVNMFEKCGIKSCLYTEYWNA